MHVWSEERCVNACVCERGASWDSCTRDRRWRPRRRSVTSASCSALLMPLHWGRQQTVCARWAPRRMGPRVTLGRAGVDAAAGLGALVTPLAPHFPFGADAADALAVCLSICIRVCGLTHIQICRGRAGSARLWRVYVCVCVCVCVCVRVSACVCVGGRRGQC